MTHRFVVLFSSRAFGTDGSPDWQAIGATTERVASIADLCNWGKEDNLECGGPDAALAVPQLPS